MNKFVYIIIIFFIISCHYKKDRLKIVNNSKEEVWVVTLTKNIEKNSYYEVSGGCEIKPFKSGSPLGRNSIANYLQAKSSNKTLYIVFCKYEDLGFVNDNKNTILNNNKFKNQKFSIKELDSLNWVVQYE